MNLVNQNTLIKYWFEASSDDFQSAQDIVSNTKSYIQGLFFLHLALEKALKALCVKRTGFHAPLTHNLLSLAQKSEVDFAITNFEKILAEINQFNLEIRYHEDLKSLKKRISKDYAENILIEGNQVIQWILAQLN